MTISRVGGDFGEISSLGDTTSVTWPSVQDGDFAFISAHWYENTNQQVNTPPGFTALEESTAFGGSGSQEDRVQVFYRECDGTESGDVTCSAPAGIFGNFILDVYRGDGALSLNSFLKSTPGAGTSVSAPSVNGAAGQGLVCLFGTSDPASMTTPSGMTAGQVGGQNTETGRYFYQSLTSSGATGAKSSTLGTSRSHIGFSILLDDAGGGGASVVPVIMHHRRLMGMN